MNKSDFLACLIRTAYFPRELPPSFTTKYFADFCKNDFTSIMGQSASLAKLNTQYDTFTMPRNRKKRRNLAIVHPLGQLAVSTILTQNKSKISKLIRSDESSLYSTTENKKENLAFQGLNFDLWRRNKNILYSEHPVVLKADISRFFTPFILIQSRGQFLERIKQKNYTLQKISRFKNIGLTSWIRQYKVVSLERLSVFLLALTLRG